MAPGTDRKTQTDAGWILSSKLKDRALVKQQNLFTYDLLRPLHSLNDAAKYSSHVRWKTLSDLLEQGTLSIKNNSGNEEKTTMIFIEISRNHKKNDDARKWIPVTAFVRTKVHFSD